MTHVAKFTGGPLDGTSQIRAEEEASAYLLTVDHGLIRLAERGTPVGWIGTYAYVSALQESDGPVVMYEWHDQVASTDQSESTAGTRINALMDRLVAVARRNEEAAEPITTYEPSDGSGKAPAWKIGYRDRVSVSRRVARGPTLETALEAWLADYE